MPVNNRKPNTKSTKSAKPHEVKRASEIVKSAREYQKKTEVNKNARERINANRKISQLAQEQVQNYTPSVRISEAIQPVEQSQERTLNEVVVNNERVQYGKVKYYGPTMGKTTAARTNSNLVDFDNIARAPIEALARIQGVSVRQLKMESGPAYKQLLLNLIKEWKSNPENENKTLVVSNAALAKEPIFDNVPQIPSRDVFIKRQVDRDGRLNSRNRSELEEEAAQYYDDLINKWYDNYEINDSFVAELEPISDSQINDFDVNTIFNENEIQEAQSIKSLKKKVNDIRYDSNGNRLTREALIEMVSDPNFTTTETNYARLKQLANDYRLHDIAEILNNKQNQIKIDKIISNENYKDTVDVLNKNEHYRKFAENEQVINRIHELYNSQYSEKLRNILQDSYDPVTGSWNRDPDVINALINSDRKTLNEFYKLLYDYGGNSPRDLAEIIKGNPEKLQQMINGTYVYIHDGMTHNNYGDGTSLLSRAKASFAALGDLGRVAHNTFARNFSVNSVVINLKGLTREINRRLRERSLPVILTFNGDTKLNDSGKTKIQMDNGEYTAYLPNINSQIRDRWVNKDESKYPLGNMLDPDTMKSSDVYSYEKDGRRTTHWRIYQPSKEEIDAEKFQYIEESRDEIIKAYQDLVDAYNRQVDAYPNIFSESDKIHLNPDDFVIKPATKKPGESGDYSEFIPTLFGPSFIVRMNYGGSLNKHSNVSYDKLLFTNFIRG